jgi:IS5 family transposase
LFKEINTQLESHQIIIKKGLIIDASVIDTLLRPKGKIIHQVTQDRSDEEISAKKEYALGVDKDRIWLKKKGIYHFGYKKHNVEDNEGIVLSVLTTSASKNEIVNLEDVLNTINVELPKDIPLKAYKD